MLQFETLTLLADDLTGALDSAAAFVRPFGVLPVRWDRQASGTGGIDTGLRELGQDEALLRAKELIRFFTPAPERLNFYKLDSLLRGHGGAALAAVMRELAFANVVIAPAFPAQHRITRHGRQFWRDGDSWKQIGEDLPGIMLQAGLRHSVQDAETDSDLDRIVSAAITSPGPTLWVGSAGLALALARALPKRPIPPPAAAGPILGLIGSDHPVMSRQLKQVADLCMALTPDTAHDRSNRIFERLAVDAAFFATVANPPSMPRHDARAAIRASFAGLLRDRPPPGLLFVSGGETLRDIMGLLGANALHVMGEWQAGLPLSRIDGGRWHGTTVLSKSGGFGQPDCLVDLVRSFAPKSGIQHK